MDLLEYQAKKLFYQVGIPVLPSQTIQDPRQIKQLQIPYPVVLKSQVRAGGRGKAGGIRFVGNTIDAIAATRNIFNLSILGEYPEVILAEARYDAQKEFFLAILLDYELQRPVLLGSACGGMDIKLLLKNLQQVIIETEFSPFYARRLASRMELSGQLLLSVSDIIEKMYGLFQEKDLDLVEINPLGVNSKGELMALDGKMTINDDALLRHPEVLTLRECPSNDGTFRKRSPKQEVCSTGSRWLEWQDPKGKVAIITNHFELALLCWDLIRQEKEKPACGVVIKRQLDGEYNGVDLFCLQLQEVLEELQSFKDLKVVLINILAPQDANNAIAQTIFDYCQPFQKSNLCLSQEDKNSQDGGVDYNLSSNHKVMTSHQRLHSVKLVVRLAEEEIKVYQEEFSANCLYWTENLQEAISQTILTLKG